MFGTLPWSFKQKEAPRFNEVTKVIAQRLEDEALSALAMLASRSSVSTVSRGWTHFATVFETTGTQSI